MLRRHMNIDYTLCQALQSTDVGDKDTILVYYDINCQHSRKFLGRVEKNPYLQIPPNIKIIPGIGLLHVTEHKPECVPRFAPSFIKGAGLVAGEIIESLWAGLITSSSSTRTATKANRAETLDDHMNDSNWSKLLNIVETTCKLYQKAEKGLPTHKMEFEERSAVAGSANVKRWSAQADMAQSKRHQKVEVMDVYLARAQRGTFANPMYANAYSTLDPTRSEIHTNQLADEQSTCINQGLSSWLASGFRIEESQ
jgi:hypothetical protein